MTTPIRDSDRLWVYVAGPYTVPSPTHNTRRAICWADKLWDLGFMPIVPHVNLTWDLVSPHSYGHWIEYTMRQMLRCDAVFRFSGFSEGAEGERARAEEAGIPFFETVQDLVVWGATR